VEVGIFCLDLEVIVLLVVKVVVPAVKADHTLQLVEQEDQLVMLALL
jgi:hypothetical protein